MYYEKAREKYRIKAVGVMDFVFDSQNVWFVSAYYNLIFKMDLPSWKVTEMYKLPFGDLFDKFTVNTMYKQDDSIILIPQKNIEGIVKFNTKNEETELIKMKIPSKKWGNGSTQDEEYIYMPDKESNEILRFNKFDYSYDFIKTDDLIKGIDALHITNNIMWISEVVTGNLYKYGMDNGKIEVFEIKPEGYKIFQKDNIAGGIAGISTITVFPRYSNMIISVDENNNIQQNGRSFDDFEFKESLCTSVHNVGNTIAAYMNGYNRWMIFDENINIIEEKEMIFENSICEKLKLEDTRIFTLSDFIESVI